MNVKILEIKKELVGFTVTVDRGGNGPEEFLVENKNDLLAQLTKKREQDSDYEGLKALVNTTIML